LDQTVNTKKLNGYTKKQAISIAFKVGFEAEKLKTNCAQATFHSISSVLGIRNPQIFKSLYSLAGGGASSTCGSCGAFSGALVAFGFFFGRTYEEWQDGKMGAKSGKLAKEFYEKFMERFNTVVCMEIHKKLFERTFNFSNKKDMEEFEKLGGHTIKCPTVVGLSSAWAIEILWDYIPGDIDTSKVIDIKDVAF